MVRVYRGVDGDGKRRYQNKTVHGTKTDAQKVLNKMLREQDLGTLIEPSRQTLSDYLKHWLDASVKPRVREATHREYKRTLERYIKDPLGSHRLSQISSVDIQSVYSEMHGRGLGASVQYTHTVLRMALEQAVKWQLIARNPADHVDVPRRKSKRKMRALSQEEVDRFLAATESTEWHVLFETLIGTGLRPSEALALRWTDLDLATGRMSVKRRIRRVGKKWDIDAPKTPSSRRTIVIPHGLTTSLSQHLDQVRENGSPELVFCSVDGDPLKQRSVVRHGFKPALERAGLPKAVRLYDLRHTHATLLLLAGVHPKVVAERLGHSNIRTTLDTYSHVLPSMQQDAAEKLDALIYSGEETEARAAVN